MAETTDIAWCDSTWSPWEGCTKVSPACDHCYAARMNAWLKGARNWGPGAPRLEYGDDHWDKPIRWNAKAAKTGRRWTVFPSVCDPFDNEVSPQLRIRFLSLILSTPNLTWLLLTKRIGNAAAMLESAFRAVHHGREGWADNVPANVWLGATICNQAEADRDVPKLLRVPAARRFVSIEPMLGEVRLDRIVLHSGPIDLAPTAPAEWQGVRKVNIVLDALKPGTKSGRPALDWVICGGESGPGARPMHPDWARSLRDQCAAAGTAFHFKQWGEWAPHQPRAGADLGGQMRRGTARLMHAEGNPDGHFRKGDALVERIGTKDAGRQLDGHTHDEWPVARHA